MTNAYIFGLYLSTIFAAHSLVESALAFGFALSSEDKIAEGGLAKIANTLLQRGQISKELFDRIHDLRIMRIAYFHSHVGLNERGAMKRYLDKRAYGVKLHRHEALEALKIVRNFLEETSPGFFKD